MKAKAQILLVEDDQSLGSLLSEGLQDKGFEVSWEREGRSGEKKFAEAGVDLCILDVMLPDLDGFELAHRIRCRDREVPILFLTARNLPEDKHKGFETGADDYITKPFSLQELVYRIEVFLKRSGKSQGRERFMGENWQFDPSKLCLTIEGKEQALTKRESDLLSLLFGAGGGLLTREHILKTLWGDDDYFMGRSLDVFISRLRNHLKPARGVEIKNHHGVGFSIST